MRERILIRNADAVVTCDPADRVLYNSDILICGNRIEAVGSNLAAGDAQIIDAAGKYVYPGLVNTHHHFFQAFIRNLMTIDRPGLTLMQWLDDIYKVFVRIDGDVIFYASAACMADLIKHGCTCSVDHQYCYTPAAGKQGVDRQMEAARMLGIRYHAGRGVNTLPREKGSTIPENMLETTEEYLQDCERIIQLYHDPNPYAMSQIVLAPCQPINSYPETFTETVKLARAKGVRMHTHLGEGENEIMLARWGKRTLDWCQDIGFIGEDVWYAHGWELTPEEYTVLGRFGSGVSHCPGPAILGGFPILPMREMMEAGVCLSLGCDGSATNDSSSLLDSMRTAWMMQAWHSKARSGCISPYEMLKIATVGGAKTLGRTDLGSLEPEKGADLFMIDAGKLELTGTLHDPRNLLARAGVTGETALTMVNGNVVFRDGVLTGVDEYALAQEGEAVCTRVLREPCEAFWNLC